MTTNHTCINTATTLDGAPLPPCKACEELGWPGLPKTLHAQLLEFHRAMGQPILSRPAIPSEDRVRLRAALIIEEAFELAESLFASEFGGAILGAAKQHVLLICKFADVRVDLPELADALADLDYVVEGTRLEFGIDGAPIAAAVHAANMRKADGPIAPNGKRLKPPGWTPPDVAGELRRQGWKGP